MKCDKCREEVGPLYCGRCREGIRREAEASKPKDAKKVVVLLAFDPEEKVYRFGCTVVGCPMNTRDGWCMRKTPDFMFDTIKFHAYDGDNCVRQFCG